MSVRMQPCLLQQEPTRKGAALFRIQLHVHQLAHKIALYLNVHLTDTNLTGPVPL